MKTQPIAPPKRTRRTPLADRQIYIEPEEDVDSELVVARRILANNHGWITPFECLIGMLLFDFKNTGTCPTPQEVEDYAADYREHVDKVRRIAQEFDKKYRTKDWTPDGND